ncbi:CHAD domain-containing protein [Kocuria dechangensis]|uniref:CHAD domain-containing protein n=1 Tax=Kocuria dechangensis TaxID=1176249 RepID=A0A917LYQ4_9MICC|nr:CYTH and CHAD domain-containing protein [Kocuria dechangensis]GGG65853.1 CHAD domain-containing protein [Kocuria dechangensis]
MAVTAQREIERKYELPDGAKDRIDWSVLEGYAVTDAAVEHRLEAVYYDTAEMALHRHHVALRRRTGGADDGWHVKLREANGRYEAQLPLLEGSPERMPEVVRHLVEGLTGGQPLHPIATLATTRRVLSVAEDSGAPVAEIAIDDVAAVDERHGTRRSWSEWEVELADGTVAEDHQHRIFTAVEQALFAAGGTPSTSAAKIARALGAEDDVPVLAGPTATTSGQKNQKSGKKGGKKATGADVLSTALGQLAEQLVLWDLKVRLDVPDAVHQMRVTSRSMRSLLKAAAPFFDGDTAAELDVRLRELARSLSGARDAEVTAELLPVRVAALDGKASETAAQVLQRTAEQQAAEAVTAVRGHLSNPKHLVLLADVQSFAAGPPVTDKCRRTSARKAADKMLRRALRKVQRVGDRGVAAEDSGAEADLAHRLEHLHQVRKDVKRVRYVDAVLKRSGFTPGKTVAHAAADAKQYQQVLGEIMDAGVVAGWLGRTAETFKGTGEDRYAVGVLHGAELVAVRTGVQDGHEVVIELLARLRNDLS